MLQLQADRLKDLQVMGSIGRKTVRVALQKIDCRRGECAAGA